MNDPFPRVGAEILEYKRDTLKTQIKGVEADIKTLKFRGKRVDNVVWVYGYYAKSIDDKSYIIVSVFSQYESDLCYFESIEVIPETVGQFTGFKIFNY